MSAARAERRFDCTMGPRVKNSRRWVGTSFRAGWGTGSWMRTDGQWIMPNGWRKQGDSSPSCVRPGRPVGDLGVSVGVGVGGLASGRQAYGAFGVRSIESTTGVEPLRSCWELRGGSRWRALWRLGRCLQVLGVFAVDSAVAVRRTRVRNFAGALRFCRHLRVVSSIASSNKRSTRSGPTIRGVDPERGPRHREIGHSRVRSHRQGRCSPPTTPGRRAATQPAGRGVGKLHARPVTPLRLPPQHFETEEEPFDPEAAEGDTRCRRRRLDLTLRSRPRRSHRSR